MEFYAISANKGLHRYFKGLVLTFSDIMEWYLRLEEIDNGKVVSSFDFFVDTKDELLYIIEKVYPQYMEYPLFVDMYLYYGYKNLSIFRERISDSTEPSFEVDDNDSDEKSSSDCFDLTSDGVPFLEDI